MRKKDWMLLALVAALGLFYAVFFTHAFQPRTLKIVHACRPDRMAMRRHGEGQTFLEFGLDGKHQLTEIKIVPLAAFQANPQVLPVWHLISDSKSAPVESFLYGSGIRGMKPAVPGAHAEPLQTNVTYRLLVIAEGIKGWHDFEIK